MRGAGRVPKGHRRRARDFNPWLTSHLTPKSRRDAGTPSCTAKGCHSITLPASLRDLGGWGNPKPGVETPGFMPAPRWGCSSIARVSRAKSRAKRGRRRPARKPCDRSPACAAEAGRPTARSSWPSAVSQNCKHVRLGCSLEPAQKPSGHSSVMQSALVVQVLTPLHPWLGGFVLPSRTVWR